MESLFSDKSGNYSSNNQPQVAQQNSLTEDDNDCAMSNLQTQPDQGNSSGWIAPNFDVKIDASNQMQRRHTWILAMQMRESKRLWAKRPSTVYKQTCHKRCYKFLDKQTLPSPTNLRLCVGLR